jgi:hypothetical protein
MIYLNTRMASILFAFGIFFTISCAQLGSSSNDEQQPPTTAEYEQQLERVTEELNRNPDNRELEVEKAGLLAGLATNITIPDQRQPYYRNLRDLADTQKFRDGTTNSDINDKIKSAWTREQSEAVRLLQQENQEGMSDHTFGLIISHFENAISLNPDSINTYSLLANTYYRHGDFNDAIHTLERSLDRTDAAKPNIREKLAYLYLESGDIESSIELYSTLVEDNPNDAHLRHGLANAFILNQSHEQAIDILRPLTEQYNTRYEYQEALSAQLYYNFAGQADNMLNDGMVIGNDEADRLLALLDEADSIFETLSEVLPFNEEQLLRSAAFYTSASAKLNTLKESADEDAHERLTSQRESFLEKGLPVWEKLAENHPENIEYVRALIEVYSALGMEDEAESLQRSYNL